MKKTLTLPLLLTFFFIVTSCGINTKEQAAMIFPDTVSVEQREKDVQDAFELWEERYVKQVAGDQYYVSYDADGNTVSEAHGYGMLIMVLMETQFGSEKKTIFDGMYHYAKAHPSDRNPSFMAWKQIRQTDGTMSDYKIGEHTGSATDGDMDIAYALLLADQLWGSEGAINYKQEAIHIIDALVEDVIHPEEWTIKLGDWVTDEDAKYGKSSRTSDWMIGHIATFYEVTGDERWKNVLDKTIALTTAIQTQFSPDTGLLPDFVKEQDGEWVPVEPNFLESETDPDYSYNAGRVPWRLAAGYFLTSNQEVKQQLEKMNTWIIEHTQKDPAMIKAGYELNGKALASYSDMTFIAPFALSASIDAENQEWQNRLWERMTSELGPDERGNYYSDTIRLLVMLFMEEAGEPTITLLNNMSM